MFDMGFRAVAPRSPRTPGTVRQSLLV